MPAEHRYVQAVTAVMQPERQWLTAPDPDGAGAIRAMENAINDAGIERNEITYVNAHGTSTPMNDKVETLAIKKAFGALATRVPISSTKSMIGHALGGAGAIEAVAVVKTIQTGIIHPTINHETPDPECDLNYVPNKSINQEINYAMSNTFGFGGHNAVLIFKSHIN